MRERPQIRRKILSICLFAAIFLPFSGQRCSAQNTGQTSADIKQGKVNELALPKVPSALTKPEERAEYIIGHFWDGMDFADTLRSRDRRFMEQNFVNFLSLFPHARQKALRPYIKGLLKRAAADSLASNIVNDLAEEYLADPYSPMRNEKYYIIFLEEALQLPGLPEYDRIRFTRNLKTAKKNRPGTVATNFSYTNRDGNQRTLRRTHGKWLLLLFYDPACSHCQMTMSALRENALLSQMVSGKEMTVLAVYADGDRKLWDKSKVSVPQEWIAAIDESGIVENELYFLPSMPVIYLLNSRKRVILKEATLEQLVSWLSEKYNAAAN